MKIFAINGSPRRNGNTSLMLAEFKRGAEEAGAVYEEVNADELNLQYCSGCLRCNIIKRCSLRGDYWPQLSEKILESDVLVLASPVYFHHFSAQMKKIIDRFRSFMHVRMTEKGIIHTPWQQWRKHFVLLMSLGDVKDSDARPVLELMDFMVAVLGRDNKLSTVIGTGLGISGQVAMPEEKLAAFYEKIGMSPDLAPEHHKRNMEWLKQCYRLGHRLGHRLSTELAETDQK